MKHAFRSADTVDLPADADTAPVGAITLPENYDDLELFFEPHAAAGFGHAGGDDDRATPHANALSNNITLDDEDVFDAFEEQYAYDDRIHMDMEDDEYMEDELDPHFHPTPGASSGGGGGSDYRTPMGHANEGGGGSDGPRHTGVSDPADRRDILLEDYDEAGGDEAGGGGGGGGDDDQVMYPDEVDPLPLDDDLEDENGVRGTAVPPGSVSGGGVQFKTPSQTGGLGENGAVPPGTGSTGVVLDFGKTHQKGRRPDDAPKVKRAPRPRKPARRVAEMDEVTMLSNAQIRSQLNDTSDIVTVRTPGVVNRVTSLADDDAPYGADENVNRRGGGYSVGYYRDGHAFAPPPAADAEAFGVLRGTLGGRDPLMGHQMSQKMVDIRAKCLETMWRRAGERWGAGYTGGATGDGQGARSRKRGGGATMTAPGSEAGLSGGSGTDGAGSSRFGRSTADDDDDDDMPMPSPDHDDFAMPGSTGGGGSGFGGASSGGTVTEEELGTCRQRATHAAGSADDIDDMGMGMGMGVHLHGPLPPTPANAPKGDVDWSVHTKRMLADIKPRLMNKNAEPLTLREMTGMAAKKNRDSSRGSETSVAEAEGNAPCKKGEAARIFYQLLVLKTHGFVEVDQADAYGDIDVTAGPKMKDMV